jgi:hypothetical protein
VPKIGWDILCKNYAKIFEKRLDIMEKIVHYAFRIISGGIKMRRFGFVLVFCFIGFNLCAQSPLGDRIWTEDPYNIEHNGLSVSDWFRETSGRAIVQGKTLTYWLYDTYYKNDGHGGELYRAFIDYVEGLGWTIDYETIEDVDPNPQLAESVKGLMRSRGYDVSFTLVRISDEYAYYVVNNFNMATGVYSTRIYELY